MSACTRYEPWFSAHPIRRAEVDRLRKVVALVEAAVIGPGEGHHKLSGALIGPVHLEGKTATPTTVNKQLKTRRAIGNVKNNLTYSSRGQDSPVVRVFVSRLKGCEFQPQRPHSV